MCVVSSRALLVFVFFCVVRSVTRSTFVPPCARKALSPASETRVKVGILGSLARSQALRCPPQPVTSFDEIKTQDAGSEHPSPSLFRALTCFLPADFHLHRS